MRPSLHSPVAVSAIHGGRGMRAGVMRSAMTPHHWIIRGGYGRDEGENPLLARRNMERRVGPISRKREGPFLPRKCPAGRPGTVGRSIRPPKPHANNSCGWLDGCPPLGIPCIGGGASEGGIQRGEPRRGRAGRVAAGPGHQSSTDSRRSE